LVFELIDIWTIIIVVGIIFIFYVIFYPQVQLKGINKRRKKTITKIEKEQGTKVLSMIHRKEALSFLGVPVYQYIDSDDAEQIIRAIRTAGKRPIDIIVHTPGGQMHASIQIARALKNHPEKTRVIVPYYSMSGGTIIALAADEILMDSNAVLGPIDPQIGDWMRGSFPAPSWIYAAQVKGDKADDSTVIMSDISKKALNLTKSVFYELLDDKYEDKEKLEELSKKLYSGELIHITPIKASEAIKLGLPVQTQMPQKFYDYMDLFQSPKTSVQHLE